MNTIRNGLEGIGYSAVGIVPAYISYYAFITTETCFLFPIPIMEVAIPVCEDGLLATACIGWGMPLAAYLCATKATECFKKCFSQETMAS